MKNDIRSVRLPVDFFAGNRRKLSAKLPDNCLAVLFAGKAPVMSADMDYPFFADRNFYYLTGIEQEESVLVLRKEGGNTSESLFIQTKDPLRERWTGRRLSQEDASTLSGIDSIRYVTGLEDYLKPFLSDHSIPIALEEGVKYGPAKEFEKSMRSISSERERISLGPILARIRMKKEPVEIECIESAIALTLEAMEEMRAHVRPGVTELELYTTFDHALARRGCLANAFSSIFAAGRNTLCLHYPVPLDTVEDGDLIQVDVGGRVAGLCADISRVYPANGRFTERQADLYAAVRACQESAFRTIRPGVYLSEINDAAKNTAQEELTRMGVIPGDTPADADVTSYYWHNVSHHMGHDVHDVCIRELPLEEGMVITVEPGIYIEKWGFGFRIEDDVLVTKDGCRVLSAFFPREAEEVSALITGVKGGDSPCQTSV